MSRRTVSGHFIDGAKGRIFVLLRQPSSDPSGSVLIVPPFAEEMNKCRRMVTEVALGLAQRGLATVVPDLYGTGDSGGNFFEADWATWRADLSATVHWSAGQGYPVTGLLAVRLGCALAATGFEAGQLPNMVRSVLWQPIFDGGRFLGQFLRLRIAAGLMENRKETLEVLRSQLASGAGLEVAGYSLSRQLAADLETVCPPDHLPPAFGSVAWLEVIREPDAPLPLPSSKLVASTRKHGGSIQAKGVRGEPFWSSAEIVVNRIIVFDTISHLSVTAPAESN